MSEGSTSYLGKGGTVAALGSLVESVSERIAWLSRIPPAPTLLRSPFTLDFLRIEIRFPDQAHPNIKSSPSFRNQVFCEFVSKGRAAGMELLLRTKCTIGLRFVRQRAKPDPSPILIDLDHVGMTGSDFGRFPQVVLEFLPLTILRDLVGSVRVGLDGTWKELQKPYTIDDHKVEAISPSTSSTRHGDKP